MLAFASTSIGLQAMNINLGNYTWSDEDYKKAPGALSARDAIYKKFNAIQAEFKKAEDDKNNNNKEFWGDVVALLVTQVQNKYNIPKKQPRGADIIIKPLLAMAQGQGRNNPTIFDHAPSQDELVLRAAIANAIFTLSTKMQGDDLNISQEEKDILINSLEDALELYGKNDALAQRAHGLIDKLSKEQTRPGETDELPEAKALAGYLSAYEQTIGIKGKKAEGLAKVPGITGKIASAMARIGALNAAYSLALEKAGLDTSNNILINSATEAIESLQDLQDKIEETQKKPGGEKTDLEKAKEAGEAFYNAQIAELTKLGALSNKGGTVQDKVDPKNIQAIEKIIAALENPNAYRDYLNMQQGSEGLKTTLEAMIRELTNAVKQSKPAGGDQDPAKKAFDNALATANAALVKNKDKCVDKSSLINAKSALNVAYKNYNKDSAGYQKAVANLDALIDECNKANEADAKKAYDDAVSKAKAQIATKDCNVSLLLNAQSELTSAYVAYDRDASGYTTIIDALAARIEECRKGAENPDKFNKEIQANIFTDLKKIETDANKAIADKNKDALQAQLGNVKTLLEEDRVIKLPQILKNPITNLGTTIIATLDKAIKDLPQEKAVIYDAKKFDDTFRAVNEDNEAYDLAEAEGDANALKVAKDKLKLARDLLEEAINNANKNLSAEAEKVSENEIGKAKSLLKVINKSLA